MMDAIFKYVGDESEARKLQPIAEHYLNKYKLTDNTEDAGHFQKTITIQNGGSIKILRSDKQYTVIITVPFPAPEIEMEYDAGRLPINSDPFLWVGARFVDDVKPGRNDNGPNLNMQVWMPNAKELCEEYGVDGGDAYPHSAVNYDDSGESYEYRVIPVTKNAKFGIRQMTNNGYFIGNSNNAATILSNPFDDDQWHVTFMASRHHYRKEIESRGLTYDPTDFSFMVGRYYFKFYVYHKEKCDNRMTEANYGEGTRPGPYTCEVKVVLGVPGFYIQTQTHRFVIEKHSYYMHQCLLFGNTAPDEKGAATCDEYNTPDSGENPHDKNWWQGGVSVIVPSGIQHNTAIERNAFWTPKGAISFAKDEMVPYGFNPAAEVRSVDEKYCDCKNPPGKITFNLQALWIGVAINYSRTGYYDPPLGDCTSPPTPYWHDYWVNFDISSGLTAAHYALFSSRPGVVHATVGVSPDLKRFPAPQSVVSKAIEYKLTSGNGNYSHKAKERVYYCTVDCVCFPTICECSDPPQDEFPCVIEAVKYHLGEWMINSSCVCSDLFTSTCGGSLAYTYLSVTWVNRTINIYVTFGEFLGLQGVLGEGIAREFDYDLSPIGLPLPKAGAVPVVGTNGYTMDQIDWYTYNKNDGFQIIENQAFN